MLTVNYTANGTAFSDFKAREIAADLAAKAGDQDLSVDVSTENVVYALRLLVARGDIELANVAFLHEGQRVEVNQYGAAVAAPRDFCGVNVMVVHELLEAAMDRRLGGKRCQRSR